MFVFKEIGLEDKELFDSFLKNKYENSEANFTNLFLWKDYYNTMYAVADGLLVIMNKSPNGGYHFYYPYGSGDIRGCIAAMRSYVGRLGEPLRITNANREGADLISDMFDNAVINEHISFNDYVYTSRALIDLPGKKLHSKKNHLNKFKKQYCNYVYRSITPEDYPGCVDLARQLILNAEGRENIRYIYEMKSINNAFDNFDYFGLKGGLIEIDGSLAAFSVGEALTDNMALIHIEKADTRYDGIYAAINNEFVRNQWADYEYINREEDMGIEGLRKAKSSYRPHHMVIKYKCIVE